MSFKCCAVLLLFPIGTQAQTPINSSNASSPAALQECILAVEKINKLRPNWLATSYGECRSANQCSLKNCQEEISRKQEYLTRLSEQKAEQKAEQEAEQKKLATSSRPGSSSTSSSPAALQECILAVEKINKLRPNWLVTSYGECRSANQCSLKNCQEEISRKQEYVTRLSEQASTQKNAQGSAIVLREAAKTDPLSQELNYIGGFSASNSKAFFYPLDVANQKSTCEIGLYKQSNTSTENSRIDLGKINSKALKIDVNFERDAKGFYPLFTSSVSGLELAFICKDCSQERLEKSWKSVFSLCNVKS